MNTCPKCGSGVTAVPQDYEYSFNDQFAVILRGIDVYHCHRCDALAPVIPNVLGLHRFVAQRLASKSDRLSPGEAAYLREFVRYAPQRSGALRLIASKVAAISDLPLKLLALQECNRQRAEVAEVAGIEPGRRISLAPFAEKDGYSWRGSQVVST